MTHFRIKEHSIRNEVQVIEVLDGQDNLLGVLYAQEHGLRLISKYLDSGKVYIDRVTPMALEIVIP